jgi:hypothetical protein
MVKRWPELLSLTEQFRNEFFKRFPRTGPLRAGDVHLLAVSCLSTVGYVMVRGVDPTPNGQLDPGLAAMFRLIDGVRIVTTQLMRDTAGTQSCDRPLNARGVHDYAERYSLFLDTWGVCAGPAALIDEYLQVLLEGTSAPIQANPDLAARVGDVDAALDYALHGVRLEAMVRSFGAWQGFMHERLHAAFEKHATARTRLRDITDIPIDNAHYRFLRQDHPLHETLELETLVGRWLFTQARLGLPADAAGLLESFDDLRKVDPARQEASQRRLADYLSSVPEYASLPEPLRAEVAAVAAEFFALERACLRAAGAEQHRLNERLRRKQGRPLTGEDLAHYERRATPNLGRVLAEGLGLTITADANATVLSHGPHTLTLAD